MSDFTLSTCAANWQRPTSPAAESVAAIRHRLDSSEDLTPWQRQMLERHRDTLLTRVWFEEAFADEPTEESPEELAEFGAVALTPAQELAAA